MIQNIKDVYVGIKTAVVVAGNTLGFLILMGGTWLMLQLLSSGMSQLY